MKEVTNAMLQAVMIKAVELGLLPQHADMVTDVKNADFLKAVL